MTSKLAVPNVSFSANDVETYVEALNQLADSQKTAVIAFNQQIDAIDLAQEQVVIAKQHAAAASNAIPIIEGHVPTKADFDRTRLNELNNFPVSGHLNVDKTTAFEFQQVAGWENKFKLKANKTRIDGVWHDYADTMLTTFAAPNGLQNKDLVSDDFINLAAAIVAGGTDLSQSYLTQRVVHYMVQEDIVAAPAQSNAFINDTNNNFYHENGVLRQRVMTFEKARLLETVAQETGQLFTNSVNAMTSLGWTLNANTLGEFDKDGKKAVVLGILNGRNQGAFHDGFLPNGTGKIFDDPITLSGPWWKAGVEAMNSVSDCFGEHSQSLGKIGNATRVGRYDGKFFDGIYSSDLETCMMNVRQSSCQEIRENNKRKAIAGGIQGVEGMPFTMIRNQSQGSSSGGTTYFKVGTVADDSSLLLGKLIYSASGVSSDGSILWTADKFTINSTFVQNPYVFDGGDGLLYIQLQTPQPREVDMTIVLAIKKPHKQSTPSWTGIIAAITSFKALFTTVGSKFYGADGIEGEWIRTIPDGTIQNFKSNRKCIEYLQATITDDNGVSWIISEGGSRSSGLEGALNAMELTEAANRIELISYKTKAHFTKNDTATDIDALDIGSVYASNHYYPSQGCEIVSTLIGKVPTGNNNPRFVATNIDNALTIRGQLGEANGEPLSHSQLALGASDSPAVKFLDVLSVSTHSVAKLAMYYKELKFDVDWGDNNQFEKVASGQELFTDDNGNKGVRGIASFETQDFIVEH